MHCIVIFITFYVLLENQSGAVYLIKFPFEMYQITVQLVNTANFAYHLK